VVIGVSGGLDSTQALIVAARTMDRMGLPRSNVLAYTMPGFATSSHTRSNAHALMQALGVHAAEIDIRPSARQMLHDIGHPYSAGEALYDVTFENVQAGERTSHLFRLANYHGGLVLGTGDLSELALGWATYGVGDHMSHYNVNASVPKTLIQHLIRYVIRSGELSAEANTVLQSILSTEISPELVPGDDRDSEPAQHTEAKIGPYELQDFNLYYITRYGFRPSKVAFLSHHAWSDRTRGRLARRSGAGSTACVRSGDDPALVGAVSLSLLPDQPVQAFGHPQWPQGRLGWIIVAARRLACTQRCRRDGLARRIASGAAPGCSAARMTQAARHGYAAPPQSVTHGAAIGK
jgi:NH3-dependent NAD+ synthetase